MLERLSEYMSERISKDVLERILKNENRKKLGIRGSNGEIKIYNTWCISFVICLSNIYYFSKFDIGIYVFFLKKYYYFNFLFIYLLIIF